MRSVDDMPGLATMKPFTSDNKRRMVLGGRKLRSLAMGHFFRRHSGPPQRPGTPKKPSFVCTTNSYVVLKTRVLHGVCRFVKLYVLPT